jgi:hypothetical protein
LKKSIHSIAAKLLPKWTKREKTALRVGDFTLNLLIYTFSFIKKEEKKRGHRLVSSNVYIVNFFLSLNLIPPRSEQSELLQRR